MYDETQWQTVLIIKIYKLCLIYILKTFKTCKFLNNNQNPFEDYVPM